MRNIRKTGSWKVYKGLQLFDSLIRMIQLFLQSTFCLHRKMQKNANCRKWRALCWGEGEKSRPTSERGTEWCMRTDVFVNMWPNMWAVLRPKHPTLASNLLVSLDNKLSCGCDRNPPNTMFFQIRCYHFGQRLTALQGIRWVAQFALCFSVQLPMRPETGFDFLWSCSL